MTMKLAVRIMFIAALIIFSGFCCIKAQISPPCSSSVCGPNSLCTSPDNQTSACDCLPGFIPLDQNNIPKGCYQETVMNYCLDISTQHFTIQVLNDTDFPTETFEDLSRIFNVDLEGCKRALMEDCYTVAASLEESTKTCFTKRSPLLKARKTALSAGIQSLIKVPKKMDQEQPEERNKVRNRIRIIFKIFIGFNSILALFFGAMAAYYHPATRGFIRRKHYLDLDAIGVGFRKFTYQELEDATDRFSKVLGCGSSGKVYRGILSLKDREVEIAVKKLEKNIETTEEDFMTELKIISRTFHKNLVRLLGFCTQNHQRILIYELMKNGSLSKFLFDESQRPSWPQRYQIAIEISKGLRYLHEECENQIIHCDIKPENVLLDMNYTAKISDFGLSKLLKQDQTRTDTNPRGTVGYMAPEWLRNAPVTTKVDVFSYGVLLLEIISCRRHIEVGRVDEESEEDDLVLLDWVASCMSSGELGMTVGYEVQVMDDFDRFEMMAKVGLWCVHPDPQVRPSMARVVDMLEGTVPVELPPSVPLVV